MDTQMKSPPIFDYTLRHAPYPAIDPTRNAALSMADKNVFITGGGKSIGAAIAESFAQAGAKNIVIAGRTQSSLSSTATKLTKLYNSKVKTIVLDLEVAEQTYRVMEQAQNEVGQIDILVLNAAHLHEQSKITSDDFAFDDFFRCFEINIKGNLSLTRAFLKQARKDATIINITSFMGYLAAFPYPVSGYASSKAAFDKALEYLHFEQPSLRIFTLHPGTVVSEMLIKCGVDTSNDQIAWDDAMLPGNVCVWLASSKADFLNGRTIESMWDVTEMEANKEAILADPRILTVRLTSRKMLP